MCASSSSAFQMPSESELLLWPERDQLDWHEAVKAKVDLSEFVQPHAWDSPYLLFSQRNTRMNSARQRNRRLIESAAASACECCSCMIDM